MPFYILFILTTPLADLSIEIYKATVLPSVDVSAIMCNEVFGIIFNQFQF